MDNLINELEQLNSDSSHFTCSNDICTPMGCVKEMVDAIPRSFWKRKDLKILDPCAGNGNFHGYIKRFLPLSSLIFNEINEDRISNIKRLFGEAACITKQDFLQYNEKRKFDLIVANPPFAIFKNGKRVSKNHNLSRLFIQKALKIVKSKGFLLFIVPNNWMSFSDRNNLPKLLSQYQFIRLNIHGAKRWFPKVGSSFTWFLLQKIPNTKPFLIENHYTYKNKVKASLRPDVNFIPLYYNDIVARIFEKTIHAPTPKHQIETSCYLHRFTQQHLLSPIRTGRHLFRILHTPTQEVWSEKPHKYQCGWKVFISLTNTYQTFVDNCGMTQSIAFVKVQSKQEAISIKDELDNPLYRFLNDMTRYGNFNNIRILQRLPRLDEVDLTPKEKTVITVYYNKFLNNGKKNKQKRKPPSEFICA